MSERRDYRVSVFLPVEVTDLDLETTHHGVLHNLSITGLQVSLREQLTRGGRYRLTFAFPGIKVPIQTAANCVRVTEMVNGSGEDPHHIAGMVFQNMGSRLSQSLAQCVRQTAQGIVEFLADHEPFSGVDEGTLLEIAGGFRLLHLEEGGTCSSDWDLASSLIVVQSGFVKFSKPGFRQGREVAVLGNRGDVLGEQSILDGRIHGYRIRALASSDLLVMGPKSYAYLQRESPEAVTTLARVMSRIARRRKAKRLGAFAPLGMRPALPVI